MYESAIHLKKSLNACRCVKWVMDMLLLGKNLSSSFGKPCGRFHPVQQLQTDYQLTVSFYYYFLILRKTYSLLFCIKICQVYVMCYASINAKSNDQCYLMPITQKLANLQEERKTPYILRVWAESALSRSQGSGVGAKA